MKRSSASYDKSWTSHQKNVQVENKSLISHDQIVNRLWTSHEQAASHEQVMRSESNSSTSSNSIEMELSKIVHVLGVGGWSSQLRIMLSQSSLAGIAAGAKLGNIKKKDGVSEFQN